MMMSEINKVKLHLLQYGFNSDNSSGRADAAGLRVYDSTGSDAGTADCPSSTDAASSICSADSATTGTASGCSDSCLFRKCYY